MATKNWHKSKVTFKKQWFCFNEMNHILPGWFRNHTPSEAELCVNKEMHKQMFIAALSIIAPNWKQSQYSLEWMETQNSILYITIMENHSAVKLDKSKLCLLTEKPRKHKIHYITGRKLYSKTMHSWFQISCDTGTQARESWADRFGRKK